MADWIAVVDDDIMNLNVAGRILSQAGMRVSAVKSGQALLDFLRNNTPDLILLDIKMPELDGFATMEKVRAFEAQESRTPVPVIFLTADEDRDSVKKCLAMGAMDFIAKPFIPEILTLRVSRVLQLVRLQGASA